MKNHSQMDCEAVRAVLPLYVGGEWDADSSGASHPQVRAHVQACAACADEWQQGVAMVRLRQAAWKLEAAQAPDSTDLRARVMARIAAEQTAPIPSLAAARAERTGGFAEPRRWAPFAAAAALVLAAVGLGTQYWTGGGATMPAGTPESVPFLVESANPSSSSHDAPVFVAETESGLRRLQPNDKSVLEEARPWGLEETPAVNLEFRQGAMKMARGQ